MKSPEFSKTRDASSYNNYAKDYDRFIQRLAAPLAVKICNLAHLKEGQKILDVGCGSGISTKRAVACVGESGHVTAIDLSSGMIDVAKAMVNESNADFLIMDAEHLEFADKSFDALVSLCAILHFPDLNAFVQEAARVVKPGGRVVVSFGQSRPDQIYLKGTHYAKRVVQSIISPHQFAPAALLEVAAKYLPEEDHHDHDVLTSWSHHHPREKIEESLKGAGFTAVTTEWWGHDVYFSTADDYWDAQMAIVTEFRKRADKVAPDSLVKLKDEFLKRAQNTLDKHGSLVYPYGALYISATRS